MSRSTTLKWASRVAVPLAWAVVIAGSLAVDGLGPAAIVLLKVIGVVLTGAAFGFGAILMLLSGIMLMDDPSDDDRLLSIIAAGGGAVAVLAAIKVLDFVG